MRPICLPIFGELFQQRFHGSTPFVAGWGHLEESGETSPVLMHVQVPIVKNEICRELYRKIGQMDMECQFDDRVICAGFMEGGKDSCQGDSGGPLMLPVAGPNGTFPFYQIGIVSWGNIRQFYVSRIQRDLLNNFLFFIG